MTRLSNLFFHRKRIALITLCFIIFPWTVRAEFTLDDEKKVGREFYENIEKSGILITDQRTNDYINKLGNTVLSHTKKQPFEFRFSVINSSAVNAFATPGGYVYINRGLIYVVENEGELAGVLAHEIAHVNARHIADIVAKSQKISAATLAAIIAGAFLGGGGELSAALMSFSLATGTSLSLKYSREHEEEADRMGIMYLVDTGYDGQSMISFLKTMRRYEFYSSKIPSYFLTHPGTDERIHYIDALLQTTYRLKRQGKDDLLRRLGRIQTTLKLDEGNDKENLKYFENLLKKNPDDVNYLYGLAVTQERLGTIPKSIETFQNALSLSPDDEDVLRGLGSLYLNSGRTMEALPLLKRSLAINEENTTTLLSLGKAYEAMGNYTSALELYKNIEKKDVNNPDIFYNLGMAYGKSNQQGESHYYFGRFFKKKSKIESARFHFKAALTSYKKGSERANEIEKELISLDKPPKVGDASKRTR